MYLSHNSRKSLLFYPLAAITLCPVIHAFDITKILKSEKFYYGAGATVVVAIGCYGSYLMGKRHNPEALKIRAQDEHDKRKHLENIKQLEYNAAAEKRAQEAEHTQKQVCLQQESSARKASITLETIRSEYHNISTTHELVARKDRSAGSFPELSAHQTILYDLNLLKGVIGQLPEDKIPAATHLLNTLETYLASIPKQSIDAQQKIHQQAVLSAQNQQYDAALRVKELENKSCVNEIAELKKRIEQQKLINAQAKHTTQTAGIRAIEHIADNVALTADRALDRIDQGIKRLETPSHALTTHVAKIGDKVDSLSRDIDGRFQQQGNYNRNITNTLTQITKQIAELQKTVNAAPITSHELPEHDTV